MGLKALPAAASGDAYGLSPEELLPMMVLSPLPGWKWIAMSRCYLSKDVFRFLGACFMSPRRCSLNKRIWATTLKYREDPYMTTEFRPSCHCERPQGVKNLVHDGLNNRRVIERPAHP